MRSRVSKMARLEARRYRGEKKKRKERNSKINNHGVTFRLESKKRVLAFLCGEWNRNSIIARSRACEQPFSMCIPYRCTISFFLFPFLLLVRLDGGEYSAIRGCLRISRPSSRPSFIILQAFPANALLHDPSSSSIFAFRTTPIRFHRTQPPPPTVINILRATSS